jgi:hypothetical protein
MTYSTILVPLDGSPQAERTCAHKGAQRIGRPISAESANSRCKLLLSTRLSLICITTRDVLARLAALLETNL